MDEFELSRRVVASARGAMRPGFRDELWSELASELEGTSLASPAGPPAQLRHRRWILSTAAAAVMVVAVAGVILLWPQDESTLRDVGSTDPTAPSVATSVPAPTISTTPASITPTSPPSTAVPDPTTTTTESGTMSPAAALQVRPTGGELVDVLANAGCDTSGNCFENGQYTVLVAPLGSELTVGGVIGAPSAETDSFGAATPLALLPRRDGTWVINYPIGGQQLTMTIRDDRADGSWATFEVSVSPGEQPTPPAPIDLPEPRHLVAADEAPADLPDLVVGVRGSDLVRLDRVTGAESVIVSGVGGAAGDDLGCSDSCGISQVSVSADGTLAMYGGPGPAVGQLYVVTTDGSTEPGFVLGGGSPGALAPADSAGVGNVAVGVLGSLYVGQTDGAAPVMNASGRIVGTGTVAPAFSPDGARIFAAVATAFGTDVIALDPADLTGAIEPMISAPGVSWTVLVARADGMLVGLRQLPVDAGQVVIDVIDPTSGTVVDSVVLDANPAPTQPTGWIDLDSTGRFLLFTDGTGRLRWTDFVAVGAIGEGWGDAGW